ncbi:MAG TPA: hypothetical protein VJK30_02135 [Coxiellaceae bacterium]|nr:MAG: hypothetical protein A3E81_03810 [Gammaproteobacteria bacterium RIFCSPHIGHO2_12_FULL_36_30]HLB56119.1 hypothetical protein [Coxiellaceae bacterium]
MSAQRQIKVIGSNGQVSLGKEFSGKTIVIDQVAEGCWVIKTGQFIPDGEKWIYEPKHLAKLEKALDWAAKTKPSDNLEKIAKEIGRDKR